MVRLLGAFACAVLVTVAGGGCTGSSPESAGTTAATDSVQQTAPDSTQHTPAPGTARVRARVDSCSTTASPPTCQIEVSEVLAYGMSTPAIGTPQSMTVHVSDSIRKNRTDEEQLRSGTVFTVVLRHGRSPQLGEDAASRSSWAIVDVQ